MSRLYDHRCPACAGAHIGIIDSRPVVASGRDPVVRRRRKCDDCAHRWTTYEITAAEFEALQDHEECFTVVFSGRLRDFKTNPHKIASPFGKVLAIRVGDALAELELAREPHCDVSCPPFLLPAEPK